MCESSYNVQLFGARGDGESDDTAAIQAAIDTIPANDDSWGPSNNRLDHGYILYFPTPPARGPVAGYRVSRPIKVPGNKNIRLLGDTMYSARIQYLGTGDYAFVSEGGRRAHVYENLYFHRGGILLGGGGQNVIDVLNCGFTEIHNYGIKTDGPSVVGVRVLNCEFAQTWAGVGILHKACDNWIIGDNTKFVRLRGIGVDCHSSGVTIRDARFESKVVEGTQEYSTQPHISIEPDDTTDPEKKFAGGLSEVTGCRFGGEVGAGTVGPPDYAIRLGPAEAVPGTMTGILISRNRFLRRSGGDGPTKHSGLGAIRITKHVKECVVTGNHFMKHHGPLVKEDQEGQPNGNPRDNYFIANAIDTGDAGGTQPPFTGLFSGQARGWMIVQQPPSS